MPLDISYDVDGNMAGAVLAFQRDVHGDVSNNDGEDGIDQLGGDLFVIQFPVNSFPDDELGDGFYQGFITGVTKDAAGLVSGVEKDIFHLSQPAVLQCFFLLGSDPGVVEADKEEARGRRY